MKDKRTRQMKNIKSKSVALMKMRWGRLSGVVLLLLAFHGTVSAQNFTKKNTPTLPALTNAKAQWADFNNDGSLDLFISGLNNGGTLQTAVYINTGGGTFNNTISLTALADIAFDFGDYNNDGYIDIITSGIKSGGQKQTIVYQNNGGIAFLPQSFSLAQLSKGGILWKDLDNDSDLDILITGLDDQNDEKIFLYKFADADYHLRSTDLPPVSNGQLKYFDAQLDGSPEVIITGLNASGTAVTLIYSVGTDFNFQLYSNTLEGSAFNSIASGDLNGDAYQDIVITGLMEEGLEKKTRPLQNNTLNNFTSVNSSGLTNLSASSVDIGDLNNDGAADIVLTGLEDNPDPNPDPGDPLEFKRFKYFRNNGSFTFSDVSHTMKNIYNGDAALGDYDNDSDLDIFQIGNSDISFEANLYASDLQATVVNAPPASPTSLEASPSNDQVTLTWDRPSDDHTSPNSLSFNLYLSKNANGTDLLISPMSDHATGFRRIPDEGNNGTADVEVIKNLAEGKYYWSVQAIDNGHKASAFAPEQSFSICYPISLGVDTTICYKDNLHLEMGGGTDIVNWYSKTNGLLKPNSHFFDLEVVENDTIIVELTKSFGCTVKDTLYVTMAPLPEIDLGSDLEICSKEEFSKVLTAPYDSVNWFNPDGLLRKNATGYSYTVLEKDTIIAQVFSAYKCVNYDSVIVDVLPLPQFSTGTDQEICSKEQVLLSVTGTWPSVNWKTLVTGAQVLNTPNYSYQVLQKDTAVAQVTDAKGCVNYDSVVVDVLTLPIVDLGSNPSICYNEHSLLQVVANGSTNNWYNTDNQLLMGNASQYLHHVLQTDTLIVRGTDANNCVNSDSIIVKVLPLPQFNIGSDTAVCYNKNILLEAGAGFQQVDWFSKSKNILLQANNWFYNYAVMETDTLIARVESTDGCINYDSIKINMLILPNFSLGHDLNVCSLDSVKLSVPGSWKRVNWYTGSNIVLQPDNPSYDFRLEESLSIRTEVFHLNGCAQYDTINVNMLALPVFDLGTDKTYCAGDAASMDVGNIGTSYAWVNSANDQLSNTSLYTFTAASSERIFLTVTNSNHCEYRDSVYMQVNPLPVFTINGPSEICSSDEAMVNVDFPWQTIGWYRAPGDTLAKDASSATMILDVSTEIFATLKDINQCASTRSLVIAVNNRPQAIAGTDTLLCYGESSTIGGAYSNEADLIFDWTPSMSLNSPALARPMASPAESVTYTVKVTDSKGCWEVDSVYVEVNPEIVVDAGDNISICIGDVITLGGSPTATGSRFSYSYQWTANVGEINSTSPNPAVSPVVTTTYDVFVTTGKCEVVFDSVLVTVNPLPEVIAISGQSIGAGGDVTLSASGAIEYQWTPEETLDDPASSAPIASPSKTTVYTVIGTDTNGCKDSAQVEVLVQNNLFIPSLFTPNGDGSNDEFKLYGSGVENISFSIFDHQGNRLYHTSNLNEAFEIGWDGTAKGKVLKNDIYIWTIDGNYFNGDIVRYQGKSSGIIKLMK
jgi:gliding motility-associated-like protein